MQNGGIADKGVIFSFKVPTSSYVNEKEFTGTDGAIPWSGLVQHSNKKLYGVTVKGGLYNAGVLYSIDPSTHTYTKLKDFDSNDDGYSPGLGLLQASDNLLYGVTEYGGNAGGSGVIYSYDPASNTYTRLYNFPSQNGTPVTFPNGTNPYGRLMQASNGKLYGMTSKGGNFGYQFIPKVGYSMGYGVIFSFDPVTRTFSKIKDFTGDDGKNPSLEVW